ncbi:MAG: zinc-binding alcohol dehydrogenase family protein [Bryobacteraceae bacterium]|nr:zinc-binding alcohol dehydrogenase family protein [Bryobacteraceae bacterium]
MRNLILEKPGQFAWHESDEPVLAGGDALVRVLSVGICGTDLHAYRGRQPFFSYPRILGHELAVEVLAVGAGAQGVQVGDRCAVNPYLNCGHCQACLRGKTNCCESLKVLGVHVDGGMRERFTVPATHLYPNARLATEQLALVETLGIGSHAVLRGSPAQGERVLVIGAGPIGLSVIEFLRLEGASVELLDLSAARRAFAAANYALRACHADAEGIPPATLVFDCTGNPQSMQAAFRFVANGGKLVYVGLFVGDVTFHDPDFHRKEITLLATRNSTPAEHRRIISLMESGEINTKPWVTHRVPVDEMTARFPDWLDPEAGVVKAVVDWA